MRCVRHLQLAERDPPAARTASMCNGGSCTMHHILSGTTKECGGGRATPGRNLTGYTYTVSDNYQIMLEQWLLAVAS
jgi:hypothetical protein